MATENAELRELLSAVVGVVREALTELSESLREAGESLERREEGTA